MAIGQFGRAGQKHDVQTVAAKLHNSIARRAFYHINLDAGMIFAILSYQSGEEATQDQRVDADTKTSTFPRCRHTGGLHRMVELIDAGRDQLDEVATDLCQPDTARMTLEQENAKVSSSVFTRALTLDRLTPSAWAAWRKFRCSATASV